MITAVVLLMAAVLGTACPARAARQPPLTWGRMVEVEPYDVDDAVVLGPAGGKLQEAYDELLAERSPRHRPVGSADPDTEDAEDEPCADDAHYAVALTAQERAYGGSLMRSPRSREDRSIGAKDLTAGQRGLLSRVATGGSRSKNVKTCRVSRKLKRRLESINTCSRCTIQKCTQSGTTGRSYCSGICKKNCKVMKCSSFGGDFRTCNRNAEPPYKWDDPELLRADNLDPLSAVVVTAPAPYIPCAEIEGLPSGCPPRGTPLLNSNPPDDVISLVGSRCRTVRVPLAECESPFFPFGVCECGYHVVSRTGGTGGGWGTCRAQHFDLSALPQISLSPNNASLVMTRYSEHAYEGGGPEYVYNASVTTVSRITADVTLEYFHGFALVGSRFTYDPDFDGSGGGPDAGDPAAAGPADGDGDDEVVEVTYDDALDDATDNVYFEVFRTSREDDKCRYKCWGDGVGVLGHVQEDYGIDGGYSVYYADDSASGGIWQPSCRQCYGGTSARPAAPPLFRVFDGEVPEGQRLA